MIESDRYLISSMRFSSDACHFRLFFDLVLSLKCPDRRLRMAKCLGFALGRKGVESHSCRHVPEAV